VFLFSLSLAGVIANAQQPGCEMNATPAPEPEEDPLLGAWVSPVEDTVKPDEHWLRAALSVPDQESDDGLSQGDGAKAGGVDDDGVMMNREEEEKLIGDATRTEPKAVTQTPELEEFDVFVPLTCPDDHTIDADDGLMVQELSFPLSPKRAVDAASEELAREAKKEEDRTSSKRKREEHRTYKDYAAVPVKKSRGAGREPKKSPAGPKTSQVRLHPALVSS
jgi:hypothetical protein